MTFQGTLPLKLMYENLTFAIHANPKGEAFDAMMAEEFHYLTVKNNFLIRFVK